MTTAFVREISDTRASAVNLISLGARSAGLPCVRGSLKDDVRAEALELFEPFGVGSNISAANQGWNAGAHTIAP